MFSFFKDLFSPHSNVSSMRFMSFICVTTASIVSIIGVQKGSDLTALGMLVASLLVPAFTGKAAQKHTESKEVPK